ncbi:MAG: PAS domain S-box protein [Desulfobulbaceae bacterium]|nr:PAS domain S-box protein [Desulfobulbaceae bacterium]HIJ78702.1 PAS domain S-box protein [Deltaproteobacteria bacterium]
MTIINKKQSQTPPPKTIINKISFIFALLVTVIIANGIYSTLTESGKIHEQIYRDLEGKLKISYFTMLNEQENLVVAGKIIKGQQLNLIDLMDHDRIRPIKIMLQSISSMHDIEMIFLLDENFSLLTSNSFNDETGDPELYRSLSLGRGMKSGLLEIPAEIYYNLSGTAANKPIDKNEKIICISTTVKLIHHLGNPYGYVVLLKHINGNDKLITRMKNMTQTQVIIYDKQDRAIASSFAVASIPAPMDNRFSIDDKNYFVCLEDLRNISGAVIGKLAVAIDSSDFLQQRRRFLMSNLLPLLFTIIIFLAMFALLKSRILDKINRLRAILHDVATGQADLGSRLAVSDLARAGKHPDEVELMCLDFNHMMEILERTFQQADNQAKQLQLQQTKLWKANMGLEAQTALLNRQKGELATLYRQNDLILNSAGEGIYGLDIEGKITFVNQAALRLTGYTENELLGYKAHDLLHHTDQTNHTYPFSACPISSTLAYGKVHREQDELFWRKDGSSFPVEFVCSPIVETETVIGAVVVFLDITDRKQMERAKEKINKRLMQSQKMEAVGTLAGGIAHDFNNTLMAIKGFTDISLHQAAKDSPVFNNLLQIQDAASRAAGLTRELLLFSRREPMEFSPVNLDQIVQNISTMLNRIIGEKISITTKLENGTKLHPVLGEAGAIEQIIINLAVNAKDAMPMGGEFTITMANVSIDAEFCRQFPYARPGEFVKLAVKDTGQGIDEMVVSHVFEPFFTTKEVGKGTGLGLSVVYGIVKEHHGWINVSSEPDKGTLFEVFFPALLNDPGKEAIKDTLFSNLEGAGELILIAEGDDHLRQIAANAFTAGGYKVFTAKNSREAQNIFWQEKGEFHLFLCSADLGDESGLNLAENLRKTKPELIILISASRAMDKTKIDEIKKRGCHFLEKPYVAYDLLKTAKQLLT